MRFGIVVCPRCKKAKGVDINKKTTYCVYCNKKLDISKLKIIYETDSQSKLTDAIGIVNADMEGKRKEFLKLDEKQ